jgi:putative N6-adenine-specific DNA methylase
MSVSVNIQGYDNDPEMISIARQNARLAGVDKLIGFEVRDVGSFTSKDKYGFIITNPPYGERLEEKKAIPPLYRKIGARFKELDTWSLYLITSYEGAEKDIGKRADKNRKIYNGMIKTYYYQFMGPRPPKKI